MSAKQEFLVRDRLLRGVTADKMLKITVVKTTAVVRDAQQKHGLSPAAAVILGQTLTGALLLASALKGEERITVRIDGDGPAGMLIAEANAVGAVRGYIGNTALEPDDKLGNLIGNGRMSVAKVLYNEARPVTGTVELSNSSPQAAFAAYLKQSEQVLSALLLDVALDADGNTAHAGGILVQELPGAALDTLLMAEKALESLPRISAIFERGAYIDHILQHVGGAGAKELNRMLVDFFCSCTEEGFVRALSLLSMDELREMQGQPQELVCHYCSKKYPVTGDKMTQIYLDKKVVMN